MKSRIKEKLTRTLVAALSFFTLLVAWTVPALAEVTEEHPDWAELVKAGSVTVPSGKAYIAYESDMQYINTLANGKLLILGTFILDGVSTSAAYGVFYSAVGTIIKRGTSVYTHANYQLGFDGTFTIEDGEVVETTWYLMDGKDHNKLNIRDGGTLRFNSGSCWNNDFIVHIAGTGYNGQGAIVVDNSPSQGVISSLILDADTSVVLNQSGRIISGNDTSASKAKGGSNLCNYPAVIDLAGHDLTIGGSSTSIKFYYTIFTNSSETAAKVIFEPLNAGADERLVVFEDGTVIEDNISFEFPANARIDLSGTFTNLPCAVAINGNLTVTGSGATAKVLNGVISGSGSVTYGTTSSKMGGSLTINAANTYTGTTTLNGGNGFVLTAKYAASVPDYATKLTVNSGSVTYLPGFDEQGNARWTADEVVQLVRDTQITDANRIATVNITDLIGHEFEIGSTTIAKYFPDFDIFWNATGTGDGRYTLTGPYAADKPLNLKVTSGTVRLSGDKQINLGDVLAGGTSTTDGGTLLLDGAKDVVFGDQIVYIGKKASGDTGGIGRMVVTNASLRSTGTLGDVSKARIIVGAHERGILEIENGAVVSNQVYVGGGGPSFNQGAGVGAIYQRGGLWVPVLNTSSYLSSNIGIAGAGFYQLEGGTLRPQDSLSLPLGIGGYGSYAGVIMTGGKIEAKQLALGTSNGSGIVDFHQLGGDVDFAGNNDEQRVNFGSGGTGPRTFYFTVAGKGTSFRTGGNPGFNLAANATYANKNVIFNLNDEAVLNTRNFQVSVGVSSYEAKGVPMPMVLNVNGGVLKAQINTMSLFGPTVEKALSKVTVYEKGLTIDTAGVQYATTENRAITAAGTGGILSVTLAEPVTGVYLPNVLVTSTTGYGASLVPLFDSVTHTVTNIYVASHGWGYTSSDTITIRDATTAKKTLTADEFTVGDNVTGGFTKQGAGTLQLYNENTWAQWTKVTGGTLQVMTEGAIPSGTALTLSDGATIDFNNVAEPTFTTLAGDGGTVANGSLKLSGVVTMSAKKYLAGESTAVSGTIDLSDVTEINLTDGDLLGKTGDPLYLFRATNLVLPSTEISFTGLPTGWSLKFTNNGLRMSHSRGLCIIFY